MNRRSLLKSLLGLAAVAAFPIGRAFAAPGPLDLVKTWTSSNSIWLISWGPSQMIRFPKHGVLHYDALYGCESPGIQAMADIKELQSEVKKYSWSLVVPDVQ